jgi:hypothetical protein
MIEALEEQVRKSGEVSEEMNEKFEKMEAEHLERERQNVEQNEVLMN